MRTFSVAHSALNGFGSLPFPSAMACRWNTRPSLASILYTWGHQQYYDDDAAVGPHTIPV
jgi:hypothetical protein